MDRPEVLRLELAPMEPAERSAAVGVDPDQHTGMVRVWLKMRKGSAVEEGSKSRAPLGSVHRL